MRNADQKCILAIERWIEVLLATGKKIKVELGYRNMVVNYGTKKGIEVRCEYI